ncbi:L-rhamnose mutarotase [Pseudobacillus badius]|uniref:L-rhamnose mutarotase n=1 Tax=Bacillus badius TaxID=1455 RepID=UPI003D35788A
MKNTLLMRTEASHSLNFLIYIQNIFLNRSQSKNELKFPYIPTKCEFRKDFDMRYRELWEEVSKRISEHPINDLEIFTKEKNLFYQSLFAENDDTLNEFDEIYQSFKTWWGSFAGHIAIERSIDENLQDIYLGLANLLTEKGLKPQKELNISLIYKELNISLIYDECLLVDLEPSSYFAILSIRDCFVNSKELNKKLQASIY